MVYKSRVRSQALKIPAQHDHSCTLEGLSPTTHFSTHLGIIGTLTQHAQNNSGTESLQIPTYTTSADLTSSQHFCPSLVLRRGCPAPGLWFPHFGGAKVGSQGFQGCVFAYRPERSIEPGTKSFSPPNPLEISVIEKGEIFITSTFRHS